jgi:hypothetical protein
MSGKVLSRAKDVMPKIKALEVGESVSFPIEWMDTVRAQTSKCNAINGGVRSTRMETEERKIYVDRKS